MSLTFKLLSLVIRTAAKPIGNYIKKQAKEHDGFRRFAIAQAQRVHRIDMRMRLGILHDPAAQQRMHEREQRAADEKNKPTVRTEEQQKKHDDQKAKEDKDGPKKEEKEKSRKVQIRPLSDARAIELGANFFSEAFIFGVAAGLLIWDSWRSRRKESQRRDAVAERLQELESEVAVLKTEKSVPVSSSTEKKADETATEDSPQQPNTKQAGTKQGADTTQANNAEKTTEKPTEKTPSSAAQTPATK